MSFFIDDLNYDAFLAFMRTCKVRLFKSIKPKNNKRIICEKRFNCNLHFQFDQKQKVHGYQIITQSGDLFRESKLYYAVTFDVGEMLSLNFGNAFVYAYDPSGRIFYTINQLLNGDHKRKPRPKHKPKLISWLKEGF